MKTGSLYAERPHLSLDKRHCHTRVICELVIAAPGEVGSWKPSPDVHVQGMNHKDCVTESVGGAAVIRGAIYVHNTHIWL